MTTAPTLGRPRVPEGYGVPAHRRGLRSWADAEKRLVTSQHYWMATIAGDGAPHVVPRWGVWLDGFLWYDGSPATRHARNLARDGRCVLHLESGTDVVILHGTSGPCEPVAADGLGQRISDAMVAKYGDLGYSPGPDSWSGPDAGGLSRFVPDHGLAWAAFPKDVTRYDF